MNDALARAVLWRFLSLGFAPPSEALRSFLEDTPERRALEAALSRFDLPPPRFEGPPAGDDDFGALFGHTLRGVVCPYETEYGKAELFHKAQELADLRGWYAAFGLAHRPGIAERADHIGVECEFAGFLAGKEAFHLEHGEDEQARRVREAYRSFLSDHLGRFGLAVATQLEGAAGPGFYGLLARLTRGFLHSECARVGVRSGPRTLPLRPDLPDPAPAACGVAVDCGTCGDSERGDVP